MNFNMKKWYSNNFEFGLASTRAEICKGMQCIYIDRKCEWRKCRSFTSWQGLKWLHIKCLGLISFEWLMQDLINRFFKLVYVICIKILFEIWFVRTTGVISFVPSIYDIYDIQELQPIIKAKENYKLELESHVKIKKKTSGIEWNERKQQQQQQK